jgi:hypothetical protein
MRSRVIRRPKERRRSQFLVTTNRNKPMPFPRRA